MSPPASGRLAEDGVVVDDPAEANRLHNRHSLGRPQAGNSLHLHPTEAAWALATGRVDADVELAPFLARWPGLEVAYIAYADLRERGLHARPAAGEPASAPIHVWTRGASVRDPPAYGVVARAEREAVTFAELSAWSQAQRVVALVDEDGAVTHLRVASERPEGDVAPGRLPVATGQVLHDRVLVHGPAADAFARQEFLGTRHDGRLFLSFMEAEELRSRGVLQVPSDLPQRAAARQSQFGPTYPIYKALRAAGVVAKSGLKFGTHLRAYRGDPDRDHARWLIHCCHPGDALAWSELGRGVRLAHGVRKRFLIASAGPDGPLFVHVEWFRA